MYTLIIATQNTHKLKEFEELLKNFSSLEILSLKDLALSNLKIEENGKSFAENSYLKVQEIAHSYPDSYICADDSGLLIPALDNQPGIYSSRFGGESSSYEEKFKLIYKMFREKNISSENYQAYFICSLALYLPPKLQKENSSKFKEILIKNREDIREELKNYPFLQEDFSFIFNQSKENDNIIYFIRKVEGEITAEYNKDVGFGYDPIFYYPPLQTTFSKLSLKQKNEISHRGQSSKSLQLFFKEWLSL